MKPLPRLMVAPNGATKTKADHPALPVTIPEIVACAVECYAAGADGLHAHVRDADGQHVLDAGLYAELLSELARRVPKMQLQITTEAVGRYSPADQRALVEVLRPSSVSIALREITAEQDIAVTRRFFAFCQEAEIAVQHILYDSADVEKLGTLHADGIIILSDFTQVLHVLGRYSTGRRSAPSDLAAPMRAQAKLDFALDWAVCAFGPLESECLLAADRAGGKARIGFENNLLQPDGVLAVSNAFQVRNHLHLLSRVT